jgi:hypothetical protein
MVQAIDQLGWMAINLVVGAMFYWLLTAAFPKKGR